MEGQGKVGIGTELENYLLMTEITILNIKFIKLLLCESIPKSIY